MPAHKEEIEAARREGIKIVPLVSPIRIIARQGKLEGVEFIKNELGDYDNDGRRQPVPVKNTEHTVELDTLIIAIGEQPDTTCAEGIGSSKWGSLQVDKDTLCTKMKGVFAGGDAVTGPSTVINAIAAGKKAAAVINRYLCGEPLKAPSEIHLPDFYVERIGDQEAESAQVKRIAPPQSPFEKYKKPFNEVELAISEKEAVREAGRCLRCDLEFTQVEVECLAHGESE